MKQALAGRRRVSSMVSAAALTFVCALTIVVALGIAGFSPSHADSDGDSRGPGAWTVYVAAGTVEMQPASGASWVSIHAGAVVPGPATIRTGTDGRAALIRDVDRIVLSASTEVRLPGVDPGDPATRIVQPKGTAFFEVGPRPGWSFSVDTPYLAVVVKGTKFGVGVSGDGTSVSVSEGRVQVGRADGRSADVSAGETARSAATPGSDISVTRSSSGSAAAPDTGATPQDATSGRAASSPARSGTGGNGNTDRDRGAGSGNDNGNNGNGGSGKSGNNGNNGKGGSNGNDGNNGKSGNAGNSGKSGNAGNAGNNGKSGNAGNNGNNGNNGDNGNGGNNGNNGNNGNGKGNGKSKN